MLKCDSAFVPHPNNPDLHRIFTASEHCNVRQIDGDFKQGITSLADGTHHLQKGRTNNMAAHRLLGNSISPSPWLALGEFVGQWINKQTSAAPNLDVQQLLFAA